MINHYLIATWAKACEALGPEFEQYLSVVMPPRAGRRMCRCGVRSPLMFQ